MASPVPAFGPRWEFALTDAMAFDISRSAAGQGQSRSEWVREACRQRLDRERRIEGHKAKRAAT
jgi:metal-responsive CopG/Arc/MetJ family transcriptional regulator